MNELYYTSSWGSGAHRSEVGYFDPVKREVVTFELDLDQREVFMDTEAVLAVEDGRLAVYTAELKLGSLPVNDELTPVEKVAEIIPDSDGRITLNTSGISTH